MHRQSSTLSGVPAESGVRVACEKLGTQILFGAGVCAH